jgi:hypothetical protein
MIGEVDGFTVECHPDGRDVLVRVVGEVHAATAPTMSAQLDRAGDGLDRRLVVAKTAPTARRGFEPTGLVGSVQLDVDLNGPDSQGTA